MITHHTFLHNKVSIFPQHNNIKIKIHIKSHSQQTKLVLNVDFEGEGTCPAGPFPPELHTQWRLLELGAGWSSRLTRGWAAPAEGLMAQLLGQTLPWPHGSLRELLAHSLCHHAGSKGRELSSVKSNSGKKKPWQFLTWSVYCTSTQLVTPTQEWAVGQSRSWNPCEGGGSSSSGFGGQTSCFLTL